MNVREIILCSNHEIPTNAPNAKSIVLQYAAARSTCRISPFDRSDFENILADRFGNLSFAPIFKTFFPAIYKYLCDLLEAQKYKLAAEISREKPVSFENAFQIASNSFQTSLDLADATKYALEAIEKLKSPYEKDKLPKPGDVTRPLPENSPFLNPLGQFLALLGVPKIGKTFLVAQYAEIWHSYGWSVHWFDTPTEEDESRALAVDILKSVWSCYLSGSKAADLAQSIIPIETVDTNSLHYKDESPSVYVIDNLEQMPAKILKGLCVKLSLYKSLNRHDEIGFVFISNKGLKNMCNIIDTELSSPPWTTVELTHLLSIVLPQQTFYQDTEYINLLTHMSGGHPLVALALARKYPTKHKLVASRFHAPSPIEEDLNLQIKQLLFTDILTDKDYLNLIIRLSALISKVKESVINAIATQLQPPVAIPFPLIRDNLIGTVLEGDTNQGYAVAFVYKEVAKEYLTPAQKLALYDLVSSELLKPENKTLIALDIIDGILYALMADNLKAVSYWTNLLIFTAIKKEPPRSQIHSLLDRLGVLTCLRAPQAPDLILLHNVMLFSLAFGYFYIKNFEKAIEILENIVVVEERIEDPVLEKQIKFVKSASQVNMLIAVATREPSDALKIFDKIDVEVIKSAELDWSFLNCFFVDLISSVDVSELTGSMLKKVIDLVGVLDGQAVKGLVDMSLKLGCQVADRNLAPEHFVKMLQTQDNVGGILANAFLSQYYLQKRESSRSSTFLARLRKGFSDTNLLFKEVKAIIYQVMGDIAYMKRRYGRARKSYRSSLRLLRGGCETFEFSWAAYRLGLLNVGPGVAERYFGMASKGFEALRYDNIYGKSEGERAVTLVQQGRYYEFLVIVERLCRLYYLENRSSLGPACMVALSQVARLKCTLEGLEIPTSGGKVYAKFERGVYRGVLDLAQPEAGGRTAFYTIGGAYSLLGNVDAELRCLRTAIACESVHPLDSSAGPLIIRHLLKILIPDGDEDEIRRHIVTGAMIDSRSIRAPEERPEFFAYGYLSYCVFSVLDDYEGKFSVGQSRKLFDVLGHVGNDIRELEVGNADWWLSEIDYRRAKLGVLHQGQYSLYLLYKKAYEYALRSSKHRIVIQAGS